jgi:transmembrane 9 superfamily member 2/4
MKQDEACIVLCRKQYKKVDIAMFKQMIDQEYRVHWLLDGLPVAVRNDELGYVSRGYPVGFVATTPKNKDPKHYLFNHVRIIVRYSEEEDEFQGARIVGFEVVPFSIKHEYENTKDFDKDKVVLNTCNQFNPAQYNPEQFQPVESNDEEVRHSYSY